MIKYFDNILTGIKIKKNNLFFFSFIILFLGLLVIVKADLVGSFSLIFLALITFYFSRYYKSLATILYVALCVRLVIIFFGNFLLILPDSWGDATIYELNAWKWSQDGFFGVLSYFPSDKTSLFISWVLAFFYSLSFISNFSFVFMFSFKRGLRLVFLVSSSIWYCLLVKRWRF